MSRRGLRAALYCRAVDLGETMRRARCRQKDSVANVSQIATIDRTLLTERAGKLSAAKLELLVSGIDVVLGR